MKPLADGGARGAPVQPGRRAGADCGHLEGARRGGAPASVRDLWSHADVDSAVRLEATVPAHGVAMFRVR